MISTNLFLLVLLFCGVVRGVVRESRGGLWSDAKNWCPEGVPQAGDDIIIAKDIECIFDTQTDRLGKLYIYYKMVVYFF